MSVPFNKIPASIRVPLFYAEMDNSMAGTFQQNLRTLLIGQSLKTTGLNTPHLITSVKAIEELAGAGSMLAESYKTFRLNDNFGEVWVVPVADDEAGVAATGKIKITGPATDNGVISLYIADYLISVGVTNGDTASVIMNNVINAINSNKYQPVLAELSDNEILVTCKWKGLTGNYINLDTNYLGNSGGQVTPGGVVVEFTQMSGGLLDPKVDALLANLGDEAFEYIACPYTSAGSISDFTNFMNDSTGRWSYQQMLFGHVFGLINSTVAAAQTYGSVLNDQHLSIASIYGSPTPVWKILAAWVATSGASLSIDPARPLQTLPLVGVLAPKVEDRYTMSERNTLLFNGISTFNIVNGVVQIERVITTYQKNSSGNPDNSYLDINILTTNSYIIRFLQQKITSKYGRHKLADDGTHFSAGQPIVTPKVIRAELISAYDELMSLGLVENSEAFAAGLIVERNGSDRNRIDVLFDPDLINQLSIFALLNQFRV